MKIVVTQKSVYIVGEKSNYATLQKVWPEMGLVRSGTEVKMDAPGILTLFEDGKSIFQLDNIQSINQMVD